MELALQDVLTAAITVVSGVNLYMQNAIKVQVADLEVRMVKFFIEHQGEDKK